MVRRWPYVSRKLARGITAGLLSFVLAATAVGATSAPVPSAPHAGDRAALVALYNTTDGPNWSNDTNWLTDRPLDAWYGVTTGDDGRVTGLGLHGNDLSGQIPPELKGLSGLMRLHLSDNRLSGQIPSELGSLFHLRHLFLDGNELDGKIPPELSKLSNLVTLHLGANSLTGQIPPELGRLSRIRQLFLNDNDLSGQIPPELGGLFYLELLHLTNNALSGQIPPELAGLSDLTDLFLQGNRTFRCPLDDAAFREWLKGIRNQRGLFCSYAGDRAALVALYYATDGPNWRDNTNWLADGPLAAWFGVTTDDRGRVTGLDLHRNRLSGEIPLQLGNLSNLTHLDLNTNVSLSGKLPPQLGSLSDLTHLDLHHNRLSGPIPPELGGLSNLTHLDLNYNRLSGPIPPELGGLSSLERLLLYDNELSGRIPPELGGLSSLKRLYLNGNELIGRIPPDLGGLSALERLFLNDNDLSGPIPSELADLKYLEDFSLDRNRLVGADSFQRFPGSPWDIGRPWWNIDWRSSAPVLGRLVAVPILVLVLFALVDVPGTRRTWDWSGTRVGRQRRPRGLPFS